MTCIAAQEQEEPTVLNNDHPVLRSYDRTCYSAYDPFLITQCIGYFRLTGGKSILALDIEGLVTIVSEGITAAARRSLHLHLHCIANLSFLVLIIILSVHP